MKRERNSTAVQVAPDASSLYVGRSLCCDRRVSFGLGGYLLAAVGEDYFAKKRFHGNIPAIGNHFPSTRCLYNQYCEAFPVDGPDTRILRLVASFERSAS